MRVVLYYDLLRFSPCSIDLFIYEHFSPPHAIAIASSSASPMLSASLHHTRASPRNKVSYLRTRRSIVRPCVCLCLRLRGYCTSKPHEAHRRSSKRFAQVLLSVLAVWVIWLFGSLPLCLFASLAIVCVCRTRPS